MYILLLSGHFLRHYRSFLAERLAVKTFYFAYLDVGFADEMLQHAIDLYEFATEFQGVYSNSVPEASSYYRYHTRVNDLLLQYL